MDVKIMSGRGGGRGGGGINLTQDQLTALINARVAEALAVQPGGKPTFLNHLRMSRSYSYVPLSLLALLNLFYATCQPAQPRACTFKTFMDCTPSSFNGTECAVGLFHWLEKIESVFLSMHSTSL
ncbi:hypothetical protein Hanom_Chr04g00311021 [Helianthus anomalus]